MKTNYIKLFIAFIILTSCERKIDLSTEVFNKNTYKATIEKAYADSANKTDQEILLTFINYNLEGKIDQIDKDAGISNYSIKDELESSKPTADFTYSNILNKYARPYMLWLNNTKSYDEKLAKSLDLKLVKFLNDMIYEDKNLILFEVKNKGPEDIVSIDFVVTIENKSGEELYWGKFSLASKKIKKETKEKFEIRDPEAAKVSNMDLKALNTRIIINAISFQDGTILSRPEAFTVEVVL